MASEPSITGRKLNAPDGTEIDLILIPFPWIDEALQLDKRDPSGYPVLDLPYLVLMKMETSRAQDLADLSKMLGLAAEGRSGADTGNRCPLHARSRRRPGVPHLPGRPGNEGDMIRSDGEDVN